MSNHHTLEEREERYRLCIDAASMGTWIHDHKADWIEYDSRALGHFGLSSDGPLSELIARIHPDDLDRIRRAIEAAFHPDHADGRYAQEHRVMDRDRTVRWLRVQCKVSFEGTGSERRPVRTLGTTQDITQRRLAEESLRSVDQRLRLAYEAAAAGMWEWDLLTNKTTWSDETWRLYGIKPGQCEASLQAWRDTVHPDDIAESERTISAAVAEGREFVIEWRVNNSKDGSRWLLSRGRPVRDTATGTFTHYAGIVLDITERKATEQALRDSESRLATIIENLAEGLIISDARGKLIHWNRAALEMHGYLDLDEVCRELENFVKVFQLLPLDSDEPLPFDQWPVMRLLRGEQVRDLELRIRRTDRVWERIYSYGGAQVNTAAGHLRFVMLTITDITLSMQSHLALQHAKEQAESASRAKDHFLAVVSHELRTPLTPVLAATSELQARADLPAEVLDDLAMIRRNVDLEARLVDDLLTLTRLQRGKIVLHHEAIDLHVLLPTVVQQFEAEIEKRKQQLKLNLSAEASVVWADPTRVQQALSNLLGNAVKFTPDGGSIAVSTTSDNGCLTIAIADDGLGIEPQVLSRLFNPFEQGERTVTRKYGGLGLGLSIARQFIELHGGRLTAKSDGVNRGTEFIVELKTVMFDSPPAAAPMPPVRAMPATKDAASNVTVLMVEDHPDTLKMLSRLVKTMGYKVQTADSVASALLAAVGRRFDILLSDVGLPDGSGLDIVRQLRLNNSVGHAIALSGFGQPEDIRRSLEAGFTEHLVKPIDLQKLREALARSAKPALLESGNPI